MVQLGEFLITVDPVKGNAEKQEPRAELEAESPLTTWVPNKGPCEGGQVSPAQNEFSVITEAIEGVPGKVHDNPWPAILEPHSAGNQQWTDCMHVQRVWQDGHSECELYKRSGSEVRLHDRDGPSRPFAPVYVGS